MRVDDFVIDPGITILGAMKRINENANGIAFVCDNNKLIGAVTDGDVRRYILEEGDLSLNIMQIANRNVVWLGIKDEEQAIQTMRQKSISAIPILNSSKEIIRIYFSNGKVIVNEGKNSILNIPLVIMAGGKGTRLKPYTDILPKPLIPIGDKTITEHIMDQFLKYGCSEIYMIVNYKKDFIKAYFKDGHYKNEIMFVDEMTFRGTGGGLKLLEGKIDSTFFMSNCDILINADYSEILRRHREKGNLVTMVCAKKKFSIPYGTINVNSDEEVVNLVEKPSNTYLINTGVYVIEPELLSKIPEDTYIHITEIIEKCIRDKAKIGTYIIEDNDWMDMGQLDEMEKMKEKLGVI